jgi:MYXO-CTERM domain-containing protein
MPLTGSDETCNGIDDDCNGKIDDAEGLCADADRPTCVRRGMAAACGCSLDLDCGDVNSGRICDTKTRVCRPGCSAQPGRNGCPSGEVCDEESARCESMSGAGGSANVSGSGGVAGSSPSPAGAPSDGGESGTTPSEPNESGSGSGCGCRVTPSGSSGGAVAGFGIALAIAYLRRRRAALVLGAFALSSLTGCGGKYVGDPDGLSGAGDAAEGGWSSIGGGMTSPGGTGGGAGTAPHCVPALGEKLVAHACSHTTNGPFVAVVAGRNSESADVSDLHRTFEIQVVGAGGRLHYRAQRSGAHAFMTDVPATLEVLLGDRPLLGSPSFAIQGCGHLAQATVVELERGSEYDVAILESPPELDLFVEHVGTFGNDGWKEPCDAGPAH